MALFFQVTKNILALFVILQVVQNNFVFGANILFFNGFSSHSHLVAFEPLANKLAARGHNVTMLSPQISESKHPKVHHFRPLAFQNVLDEIDLLGGLTMANRMESKYNDFFLDTYDIWYGSVELCRAMYASQDFKEWMASSSFDLVVIDNWQRPCGVPVAYKFNAKFVFFMPSTYFYWDYDAIGVPSEPSIDIPWEVPHWLIPDSIRSEYRNLGWYFFYAWTLVPLFDKAVSAELAGEGEVIPSILELQQNAALLFLNQFHTAEYARALPPFVVPVGGMHCREAKEVKIMKFARFIENAKGFVYVSFGSFLKLSELPKEKLKIFFDVMASFPEIKFLWKWNGEDPEGMPGNMLTMSWFPQQDVLGHPKCLGFISQGGQMSFQQAVYHGVPMIIIPGGADQIFNGRMVDSLGNGIHLELSEITTNLFRDTIAQLLENKKYQKKAEELSILFKDRPMSAVDLGVYWTEYVLRHDLSQLEKLKSPSMKQTWWQRRFIHGWAGLTLLAISIGLILVSIIKILVQKIFLRPTTTGSPKIKKGGQRKKKN